MTESDTRQGLDHAPARGAHFLPDGTLNAPFLRGRDWAATPLGAAARWPQPLRTAVSLMLDASVPMWLAWGDALAMIYNEPYAQILEARHPAALGAPLAEVWSEIWPDVGHLVATTLAGQALYREDLPLTMHRQGQAAQTWFTFSYSPLRDDDGAVRGLICTVWETTGKVLAQRRLADSEARLQALTQASTNVIYRMSADWSRMLELNGQGFIEDTDAPDAGWLHHYIHPEDRDTVTASIQAAIRNGCMYELEHRVVRVDGTLGWTLSRAVPIRDAGGAIVEWFGTATDVTGRREAQQALEQAHRELTHRAAEAELRHAQKRETEERYRLAALATNDAIWDWRLADGHVVWNQALETLFGHSREESSAQWWLDHIHPEDRGAVEHGIHAVIDGGGTAWAAEYRFRRADGSHAHVFDRGTVLRDAAGGALRMIGAMLDLSERKAAEAALLEGERRYRALFDSIDEGFCVIEFLDGPHGPLSDYVHVAANPAYTANAGIPDVVGQRVRDMVPLEAEGWVQIYRQVLLTGEPVRFERELIKTGRYLELAAFRIDPFERRQVAVLFQDVTQRHRAELALRDLNDTLERRVGEEVAERIRAQEALRQAQKMEAVGQLTGGIAHDFNNMLAAISSGLQVMKVKLARGQTEGLERYVEIGEGSVRRASALTHRLLAFSRRQTLDPQPTDVNRLVRQMEELLRRTVGPSVRLQLEADPGLWPTRIDASQLENSLLNLCINARDAMGPLGGRLEIRTANVRLEGREAAELRAHDGDYVHIAVSDEGTGIAAEHLGRVFEPFFTTKPIGQGTGLGLSMVYGFVQQSEGQIHVESELGRGTTMQLYLPRHEGGAGDAQAADGAGTLARGDGETVLLVEDEEMLRELMGEVLAEAGYRVLTAADGPEGLKRLQSAERIDLMVTDVGLPGGLNGRQVADAGRLLRPALKVLFVTGYAEKAAVGNGLMEAGMQVMTKPFEIAALAERVKQMLAGAGTAAAPHDDGLA